jgi:type IV secretory pathway VirB10-like protein
MSTILDALRKAKAMPAKESVDARREILSSDTHDYLAVAPDNPDDRLRAMKMAVGAAIVVIILLLAAVVVLLFRSPGGEASVDQTAALDLSAQASPTPSPVEALAAPISPPPPPVATPPPDQSAVPIIAPTPQEQPEPPAVAVAPPAPAPRSAAESRADREARRARAEALIGSMTVTGIIMGEDSSAMAIIDGQFVKKGSLIGGARVVKIGRNSVVLSIEGEEYTLRN